MTTPLIPTPSFVVTFSPLMKDNFLYPTQETESFRSGSGAPLYFSLVEAWRSRPRGVFSAPPRLRLSSRFFVALFETYSLDVSSRPSLTRYCQLAAWFSASSPALLLFETVVRRQASVMFVSFFNQVRLTFFFLSGKKRFFFLIEAFACVRWGPLSEV